MLSVKRKGRLALLLVLVLVVALTFSSCAALMDAIAKREVDACRTFFDYVSQNSYAAAYDSVKHFATPAVFQSFWPEVRAVVAGAESYTLSAKHWTTYVEEGEHYTEALILLTTDTGNSTLIYTILYEGEWLCGMQLLEVTDFVNATSYVPTVNLILILFSVLCFAFILWMFIDSLVRPIKLKPLWALITLAGVGAGFTVGAETLYAALCGSFFYPLSLMIVDYTDLSVTARAVLPVGAIVYLCLRRRLMKKATPTPVTNPTVPTAPVTAPPETTVEVTPEATVEVTPEATVEVTPETAPEALTPAQTSAEPPVAAPSPAEEEPKTE